MTICPQNLQMVPYGFFGRKVMELDHDKLQEAFKNQKKLNVIDECDLRMLLLVVHLIKDKNC